MDDSIRAITWEAPEHHHIDKSSDWFWVLGIIAICGTVAAFFFGNFLFALVILLGSGVMALRAVKPPAVVPFMVGKKGVRVGEKLYTYSALASYFIDEEDEGGPQLLLKANSMYSPLIVMPIPEEYIDDIEDLLKEKLPEEELHEPLGHKVLEMFGF
ncbi:hypothetical protein H6788_01700 [Candidatus Nomurabacteria bacterium]|nr:hypothetical protein [Candidatus Nomurabacteria bacterium]